MYELKLVLQTVALPPMNCFILVVIAYLLPVCFIRRVIVGCSGLFFIIFSIPAVGYLLMPDVSQVRPLTKADVRDAEAIVVLSAGIYPNAPEYDGIDVASNSTLVRARYAAWLYRKYNLPILVVGERVVPSKITEAAAAAELLENEFHVPVRWVVESGRDTIESSLAVRTTLFPIGVDKIALITNAQHMERAKMAFSNSGFFVYSAPTNLLPIRDLGMRDFMPASDGFSVSRRAMNEWLGLIFTKYLRWF